MIRKFKFSLMALAFMVTGFLWTFPQPIEWVQPVQANDADLDDELSPVQEKKIRIADRYSLNITPWLLFDETSLWTPEEVKVVERVLANAFGALEQAGLDGERLLAGYRFRRFEGAFALNKAGKIGITNHTTREIILSDSILLPENEFYIYHELGHVLDHMSNRELNDQFHTLTMQIEGVTTLHDWTTAQGFFLRGQAHVTKTEATADAFAIWVYVGFVGNPIPSFKHMPANAQPQSIIEVFTQALEIAFGGKP